jgi:hypothetical protein
MNPILGKQITNVDDGKGTCRKRVVKFIQFERSVFNNNYL